MEEVWKDIKGYEGLYQVSSLGRVKSLNYRNTGKEHILKQTICMYYIINLHKNGIHKHHFVHRLVAEAFIPNPHNYPCVNHKDEDKTNNCVDNLEWCTYSYNTNYGNNIQNISNTQKNDKRKSKIVLQYDLEGNFIKEWPSTREIERQLHILPKNVSFCCRGFYKQANGYIWRYK